MKTLKELFQANESELKRDLVKIATGSEQEIITAFGNLFTDYTSIEEYKKDLSKGEMAIFQSAVRMIHASMDISETITSVPNHTPTKVTIDSNKGDKRTYISINKTQLGVIGGTTMGFIAGISPNIVTIPVALIACALGFYVSRKEPTKVEYITTPATKQLNVEDAISKIYAIAEKIDRLMEIYRTNVYNIKAELTNRTPVTLSNKYSRLLDNIRGLYSVQNDDELKETLKTLRRSLTNYGYQILDYSEENKEYFNIEESEYVSQLYVESLAILEGGSCIEKGTVFVPKK